MDRQKVLLDLAAELIKLATDDTDDTELKRAKKRRNIALGTGLAGGLGAALGIARKNPQEVQAVHDMLNSFLQDAEKQGISPKQALKQMDKYLKQMRKAIPLKYRVGISQIGGLVGLGSLPFAIYYAHKAKKLSKKERTNKMQ